MIGQLFTSGIGLAALPVRLMYRSTKAMLDLPSVVFRDLDDIRHAANANFEKLRLIVHAVDADMREKTAHLNDEQKRQAASLALSTAEQHLGMAVVDMLRALWLASDANSSDLDKPPFNQ